MIENSSEDRVGDEQRASSMPSDWKVSCTFVAQVMEQYKHQLLGFFYKRILGTKGDAEDLLQETALNLTTHVQKYGIRKIQEKIHGYLFTIAKHVMIDYIRNKVKSRETPIGVIDIFETDKDNPLDDSKTVEFAEDIYSAFLELNEKKCYAWVSHYMGKSYREIGEKLGVSIGQAFNLVKDATRELQAKLNRKGYS